MSAVLLSSFESGHITGSEGHPWLQKFEGMFEYVVKAYEFVCNNDLMIVLPGVVENNAVQKNAWYVFPIYVNRNNKKYIDFLSYKLGVDIPAVQEILRQNMPEIFAVLDSMTEDSPIINVTYYRMRPGTTLKLHADSGAFQYRAHMGVKVPKGNCGLRVKDSVVKWKEGRFFVFDSTQPHMAWNLTQEERIVFSIDLLREPLAQSRDLHLQEVLRRMDSTPLGFEGGGYIDIDSGTMDKFNRIVNVLEF
jgi:hypothetical protein